uniref:Uncharacterized protein n=1 Tax=Tanacetum cinerariifolium TaxID=118510 RepID=A0A699HG90_TANCI|nr:hypothetical protein [Tanacetum cinerariifolium]
MNQPNPTFAKIAILDTGKFEQWKFRIQQYLQNEHYALWEVIEFSDSYKSPLEETGKRPASESSAKKKGMTVVITTEDMQKRRNDVKARTTLLLALPDEHQSRFSKYETAQELWEAILKTFETLKQTFNRLQAIVSHLEFIDVEIEQDDLNQNFLTSLAPEWLMYTIVWRNRDELDTMSLDYVYNHLKVYEPEVQKKSESNSQNMAFISSSNTSSGKGEVHTADVAAASLSHATVCAYIASQSNGSQIKYEDITQIDEDDIEEMDIKWNMALLSMRADRFWKKTGKKITIQGSDVAGFDKSKVECINCHKIGHFTRECRAPRSQERGKRESYKQGPEEGELAPKTLMAIDGSGWDWSYMSNEEENHALVADDEVPTEFALMAKSSSSLENKVYDNSYCSKSCRKNTENLNTKISKLNKQLSDCETDLYHYKRGSSQVETRLVEFKEHEIKFCEKIRGLERDVEVRNNKIEYLENELDSSPPAQVYSPPKKDLSWTGLPEFVDDTITDYSRPTPSIDSPKSNTSDLQSSNFSVSEHRESSCSIMSKPMIKFVKAADCPGVIKTNKTKTARKSLIKYVEMYRNTSKSLKVRGNQPHSNVQRPFQRKLVVRTQPRVPRVCTVTGKLPTVDSKFSTAKSTFTADLGNKGKVVKALACWIWRPKQNTTEKGPNCNGVSVTFKKYDYIDTQGRLKSDSGCSRHMNGNISYLSEYEPYDGGYVSFGHGGGKITGKGIIKTGKLEFENVYLVKELKYNLFSVSQIYDNKNSILFTDSECIVLAKDFKLTDDTNVLLRTPRQHNMYSFDLNNIISHKNLTCLVAKASVDESMLWHKRLGHLNFKTMNKLVRNNLVRGLPSKCFENNHTCVACLKGKQHKASCKTKLVNSVSKPLHTLHMDLFGPTSVSSLNHKWYCLVVTDDFSRFTWTFFLRTKDETSSILRNLITEIENLKDLKVKIIRCDNGGEFKNKETNEFCTKKSIRREFSNARTPQQNGVAERRNQTLIEAARTMLADAKLLVTFWAEAVNTAYHLEKFDAKGDEGYFVRYSLSSKTFRVFNKRTKKVEENLHVDYLKKKLIKKGAGPNWLFDIDTLTNSMNYMPVVVAETSSTNISGTKDVTSQDVQKDVSSLRYIFLSNWFHEAHLETRNDDAPDGSNTDVPESSGISNPTATSKVPSAEQVEPAVSLTVETETPNVSSPIPTVCLDISPEGSSDPRIISKRDFSQQETSSLDNALTLSNKFKDIFGEEADLSNMETSIPVSPTSTVRIHKDHPKSQIIGPVDTPVQTKHKSKEMKEQSFIATIHQKTHPDLL